jgi:hypothetical protein
MKAVAALALIVLVGCDGKSVAEKSIEAATGGKVEVGKDGNVVIQTDKGTMNVSGADGSVKISGTGDNGEKVNATFGTGGTIPAGFPLPVLDGMQVVQGATTEKDGKKTFFVMGTTTKSAKDAIAFYEPEVKKISATANTNHLDMNGAHTSTLSGEGNGKKVNITAMQTDGKPTNVTIACEGF